MVYFGTIKCLVWGAVSAARLKNLNSLQRDPPRKRRQAGMGPKSKGQLGNEDLQSPLLSEFSIKSASNTHLQTPVIDTDVLRRAGTVPYDGIK